MGRTDDRCVLFDVYVELLDDCESGGGVGWGLALDEGVDAGSGCCERWGDE